MSTTLEQYRASIGGFTPPGQKSFKGRRAAAWRDLWGEEVVDRVGREGRRKLLKPLVQISIGFLLISTWFIFVRHLSNLSKFLQPFSQKKSTEIIYQF